MLLIYMYKHNHHRLYSSEVGIEVCENNLFTRLKGRLASIRTATAAKGIA